MQQNKAKILITVIQIYDGLWIKAKASLDSYH